MRGPALSVAVGAASFVACVFGSLGLLTRLMSTGLALIDSEDPDGPEQWL